MTHWTEAAISKALEGRFYNIHGFCENEARDREKRRVAEAVSTLHRNTRQRIDGLVKQFGPCSPQAIIAAVAYAHGIGPAQLVSKSRKRNIVNARHHACALLREVGKLSFPSIAIAVGVADHTTANHACQAWKDHGRNVVFAPEDAVARGLLGVGA